MTRSPVRADRALVFFFASSFAETVQAVGILWAAFALTDSGVVVGAVNAAAYLPGVVVGLLYRNRADSGDSAQWLTRTNWALVLGSAVLTIVWIAAVTASILVVVFIAAQTLLSVVKMLNKAYVGRFVREQFDSAEARRLLERATSLGLIGGLVGGSLGGLLLDVGSAGWTFALAAIMYVVSLGAIRYAVGPRVQNRGPTSHQRIGPAPGRTDASRRLIWLVLVFSIPSSGALPYISTLTVPLSNDIAPGSGVFYAALTVVTALGGFVAGMALSAGKVTLDRVLSLALIGSAALCIGLREATWAPAVLLLVFLVAVLLTSHVISMQVLTNQVPAQGEVGKFTVLRNCVAGLAKGGFSLLAGWFIDVGGPAQCWLLLAAVLAVFGVGWHIVGRRCGGSSLVS